jgi:hypothetical protein
MKLNYYSIFKNKLYEEEVRTKVETESNLEKVLRSSKKVTDVLTKLLTSQKDYNEKAKDEIREIVADVKYIAYKPTTFRIVFKNANYFDLKYDPTPLQGKYPEDYAPIDSFTIAISGKKYNLANKSEMEQAIDYTNYLLKTGPIVKEPEPIEEPGSEEPEAPEGEPAAPEEEPETPPEEAPKEAPKKKT